MHVCLDISSRRICCIFRIPIQACQPSPPTTPSHYSLVFGTLPGRPGQLLGRGDVLQDAQRRDGLTARRLSPGARLCCGHACSCSSQRSVHPTPAPTSAGFRRGVRQPAFVHEGTPQPCGRPDACVGGPHTHATPAEKARKGAENLTATKSFCVVTGCGAPQGPGASLHERRCFCPQACVHYRTVVNLFDTIVLNGG